MVNLWTKRGRTAIGAIGLVMVLAPLIGAQLLINRHTLTQANERVAELADETLLRADAALDAGLSALSELASAGVSRCADRDRDLMRRVVAGNASVKEVAITDGHGRILCNHIGDEASIRIRSPRFASRDEGTEFQLVEIASVGMPGTADRRGGLMIYRQANGVELSALVPSAAIAADILPRSIRRVAEGRLTLPDGTLIGSVPPFATPRSGVNVVSASVGSERYPVLMSLSVPFRTFLDDNRDLVTYASVGGVLAAAMIFGLILYVLRGPSRDVGRIADAAARGEFIPYYQPVVDLRSGRLVGCEVLMRWQRPDGTVIGPSAFIEIAEATGLAWPMTLGLMRQARNDLEDTFGARPDLKISINLFPGHFASLRTVSDVLGVFGGSKISLRQLVFEVTERQPLANIGRASIVIARLRQLGARIALDDAGTGHAGLANLQQLGIDIIKIDKLFIETIDPGRPAPIVDSLIKLGHDLGMEVIAEGVETAAQIDYLRERGADSAQGYIFAPPLPARAFLDMVRSMTCPTPANAATPETAPRVFKVA